jgi:DNA-binding IscR family transcriptional regulator
VRYVLLALLELASHHQQGNYLQIDQIAEGHQIPNRYLAQLD